MSWPRTRLSELLGVRLPIVQAPMAGGPTTPELVAAVSEAGGLGSIGAAMLGPDALRAAVREVRSRTDRPFAVNLFAPLPSPQPGADVVAAVDAALAPHRRRLGLADPDRGAPPPPPPAFDDQLTVVLDERVPVLSSTFGAIEAAPMREAGITTIGTATSVAEARAQAEAGVEALVAQGAEAGGHRGTFLGDFAQALVGTMALVPQVADAVDLPVIAAGGIADGRGIAAALALGAEGAVLGTAFLACPEAGVSDGYRRRVLAADDTATSVTDVYTGRPARAIRTPLIDDLERSDTAPAGYPAQAGLLADLRAAGVERDEPELLFLLAGQAAGMSRPLPAGELVATLARETEERLRALSAR